MDRSLSAASNHSLIDIIPTHAVPNRQDYEESIVITERHYDQDMLQEKIKPRQLLCPSKNLITDICNDRSCSLRGSFMCYSSTCESCCNMHNSCNRKGFKLLTQVIEKRMCPIIRLLKILVEQQIQFSLRIKKEREEFVKKNKYTFMHSDLQQVVDYIYQPSENTTTLNPQKVYQFIQSIDKMNAITDTNFLDKKIQQPKQDFELYLQAVENNLKNLKQKFLADLLNKQSVPNILEDSSIINHQNLKSTNFIYQSLNKPKHLKLLFRASEHKFQASKFHQMCDDIPKTFVLLKTEANKVIAGYTPLQWKKGKGEAVEDPTGKSFLLSIDSNEKMFLQDNKAAVIHDGQEGPIFGQRYSDIYIRNNGYNCKSAFPNSYNSKNKRQKSDSVTKAFSGASNQDILFKVEQYQVYQVFY